MPIRHQHLATALLDEMSLHIHRNVTDPVPRPAISNISANTGTEAASGSIAQPPRQIAVATRLTVCEEYRSTSRPVKGIPTIDPIPTQTSANASCVGMAPT